MNPSYIFVKLGRRRKFLVGSLVAVFLAVFGAVAVPSGDTYADDTCAGSGAAGSLGWIVCPALDLMGGASTGLYDNFVKPSLEVEPQLFTGKGKETQDAWGTFRSIANTLLIILLLGVIFSQLTGIGIDNYGIKKILPKLILAAILMNLSYWICVAFVDLSNILGNSLQAMFNEFAKQINLTQFTLNGTSVVISIGSTLISMAIIAVLIAGAGMALVADPAMILALALGVLGVFISIVFLFILLAVRQAAIVVMVVLSPIAIACMMLPNTKSLFDKWLKLFEGLLLVYPIAGLLIGGGNYVSKLLLASGFGDKGWYSAITAMVVGIVPIFFIPTVLKNSFSAMGNLGAKIAGMGQGVSRATQRAVGGSQAYKNAQERMTERGAQFRAGLDRNGEEKQANGRFGRFRRGARTFFSGGERNVARARSQYLKAQDARNREEELMGDGLAAGLAGVEDDARRRRSKDRTALMDSRYGDQGLNELMTQWRGARDTNNSADLDALTNVIHQRYGARGINKIADGVGEVGVGDASYDGMVSTLRQTMHDNPELARTMEGKTGDVFDMMSNGGVGEDGQKHDLSYFTQNMKNGAVTSAKDWSTQTSGTLRRAAAAGALDEEMIDSLLTSSDPVIQSSLQGDPSKRDALQAAAYRHAHSGDADFQDGDDAEMASAYRAEQAAREASTAAAATQQEQQSQQTQQQMAQALAEINNQLRQHGSSAATAASAASAAANAAASAAGNGGGNGGSGGGAGGGTGGAAAGAAGAAGGAAAQSHNSTPTPNPAGAGHAGGGGAGNGAGGGA